MASYLDNLFNLEGKVVIITGGTGLLGRAFTRSFLECGAKVVFTSTSQSKADEFAGELKKQFGENVLGLAVDVSKNEDVEMLVSRVREAFGKIDVLINNAGIPGNFSSDTVAPIFENYPRDEWDKMWDVNVTGMFLCAQEAGKEMAESGGGAIINISSIYGLVGPDQRIYEKESGEKFIKPVAYSVTKGAIINFTRYLATYWGDKNIRVNTLAPGGIFNNQDIEFIKKYSGRTPLRRMAKTEDIIGPALFLASDASKYMTGATLVVDGGWTAW